MNVHLAIDVLEVGLDGFNPQPKLVCNLLVGVTLGKQHEHFRFPRAQSHLFTTQLGTIPKISRDTPRYAARHRDAPLEHFQQGGAQLRRTDVFRQITVGTHFKRRKHQVFVV